MRRAAVALPALFLLALAAVVAFRARPKTVPGTVFPPDSRPSLVYRAPDRPRDVPRPKPADQGRSLHAGTDHQLLSAAVAAILRGDDATARALAPRLTRAAVEERLAESTDPDERTALHELLGVLR